MEPRGITEMFFSYSRLPSTHFQLFWGYIPSKFKYELSGMPGARLFEQARLFSTIQNFSKMQMGEIRAGDTLFGDVRI